MGRDEMIEALTARVAALEAAVAMLMAERADREDAIDEAVAAFSSAARPRTSS